MGRTPREKKRLRAQVTDPISGRRKNVYADDPGALAHRVSRLRGIRDDLQAGIINRAQAEEFSRPIVSGPLTMALAFERYVKTLKPPSARIAKANWKARLKAWFELSTPWQCTREKMAAWEADLVRRGDAPKTIKNSYDHLAACCRMMIDSSEIDGLPWGDVSRFQGGSGWRPQKAIAKKTRRALATVDQLAAFLACARADDMIHWKRGEYSDRSTVLAVLFLTGLRQAEACALSWEDLSLDEGPAIMRVNFQAKSGWHKRQPVDARPREPTKTRTARSQALHKSVVQVLKWQRAELYRRGWYRPDGPVFPGLNGAYRTTGRVIKPEKMREYAKSAGFPFWQDWVTHSTRHSFATLEVVASGGDLKATQARTGHADVRQLAAYLHDSGRFAGESAVGDVPMLPPAAKTLPGDSVDGQDIELVAADPWGIEQLPGPPKLEAATLKRADWVSPRAAAKAELEARAAEPLAEIARRWIEGGQFEKSRSGIPPEVQKLGAQAAARNYRRAERKKKPAPECAAAARRARQALYAAWTKAMRKALGTSPSKGEIPA